MIAVESIDIWSIIGRVAVIATILTALFKFVSWWRAPKEKLVARVLPTPFALPPTIESEFKTAGEKVQQALDAFFKEWPKKKEGYDEAYSRSERLAFSVRHAIDRRLSYENRQFSGCWHVRVDNNGKRKCSGVSLQLPNTVLAKVQRDSDHDPVVAPVKGLIEIGELRPQSHCFVTAWTDRRVENRDNYEVIVTHDSGIGKVIGQWQTSRVGWIAGTLVQRENLLSLLPAVIFAALGIAIAWSGLNSLLSKTSVRPFPNVRPAASPTPLPTPNMPH
jgi:hypothetical protein